MVNYYLLAIARQMPDHATPPARMVGGDRPVWDADLDWDLTVRNNPHFISLHVLAPHFQDEEYEYADVKCIAVSGTVGEDDRCWMVVTR